jgi:3-hydroxyacyl-[acyl-carrier-protein] dehydratase
VDESETTQENGTKVVFNINDILGILPHRYPFLLVDRIIELEPEKRIVGLKNVTINEPFFQGHFPGAPIMPGVLVIEAMAQVAGIMTFHDLPERDTKLVYFTGIENAKFRRPVIPGDQLRLEMVLVNRKNHFGTMSGRALVDGRLVAEATVRFAIVDRPSS